MIKKFIPIILVTLLVIMAGCRKNTDNAKAAVEGSDTPVATVQNSEMPSAEGAIAFLFSLDEAKEAARAKKKFLFFKQRQKPIMIDLYTDWCVWCKKLDENTYSDPDVAEYVKKNIIPLKIHAEKDPYLAKKFKVTGYPTILFIDSDENEIDRLVGYFSPEDYLEKLKTFFDEGNNYASLKESFDASPSIDNAIPLLDSLNQRGMYEEALSVADYILTQDAANTTAVTVKFQVLFGKQDFGSPESKKVFLDLAQTIEKGLEGAYASFNSTYYLIISSFYYAEKDFANTLRATDELLKIDEVKANPGVESRVKLLKVNSLIRRGDLKTLQVFVKSMNDNEVATNFNDWVSGLKDGDILKNFGRLEDAIGDILTQINVLYSQGKNIETDSPDLKIPADPISGKKIIYKCNLGPNNRPEEFVIKTPSPKKYGAKEISFNIKTGKLDISL